MARGVQALVAGVLAVALPAAMAQVWPDAGEILKQVSATYKSVSEYEFPVDASLLSKAGKPAPTATHLVFAFRSPNHYRMQGAVPDMAGDAEDAGEVLSVYGGASL